MEKGINYEPTDVERRIVATLFAFGHSIRSIAKYLDMDENTLQKYFKREKETGKIQLSLKCGGRLLECVMDTTAKDSDRNDAAKWLLSRSCGKIWNKHIKDIKNSSTDSEISVIRSQIDSLQNEMPVNKEVSKIDSGHPD